jgi:DNA-directed RNA polymerase subunit RPC12/RpoP
MAEVKLIAATCPRCGASLNIPDSLSKAHCMYCGTLILVAGAGTVHEHKDECRICEGYGRVDRCKACDGSGECTWTSRTPGILLNGIPVKYDVSRCEEGACSICHGTGKRFLSACDACGGSGRCPRCMGSGKCVACRGQGFFPNPNGAEKCRACGGTGTVNMVPQQAASFDQH